MPYFSRKFGRDVVPLTTLSGMNAGADTITKLIRHAEKEAQGELLESGKTWPERPMIESSTIHRHKGSCCTSRENDTL
jgi:hypothetical protein